MEYVTTLEELEEKLQTIVYKPSFDSKNCSVCTVDKPIVEKIATKYEFPTYIAEADKSPEIIGQLNAFLHRPLSYTMKEKKFIAKLKLLTFKKLKREFDKYKKIVNQKEATDHGGFLFISLNVQLVVEKKVDN